MPHGEIEAILNRRPLKPMTSRTIRDRTALYRELGRVRRRGYAIDNEEDSRGARCVAAPILDPSGHVRAAISISGPATRVTPAGDAERAKALMEACGRISTLLGYTPAPRAMGRTGVR
jgi:DNA-binding IclR family transcriptional regulator